MILPVLNNCVSRNRNDITRGAYVSCQGPQQTLKARDEFLAELLCCNEAEQHTNIWMEQGKMHCIVTWEGTEITEMSRDSERDRIHKCPML